MHHHQAAVEALYSATYVENYIDCVENLPDDLQRHLTRLRELDVTYQGYLKDVEQAQESSRRDLDSVAKRRNVLQIQRFLIAAQEIGDEKLQVVQQILDLIENKSRQLDLDLRNLDSNKDQENTEPNRDNNVCSGSGGGAGGGGGGGGGSSSATVGGERQSKRARRSRNDALSNLDSAGATEVVQTPEPPPSRGTMNSSTANHKKTGSTSKKKKRKSRQQQHQREETPPPEDEQAIDPDEPTYCLCDQISYGEMILCDNDLCPIEWFHFSCVSLTTKPKGKWFCPKCRGDRPNIMKPKAQFLKELERYNKEKEEKA